MRNISRRGVCAALSLGALNLAGCQNTANQNESADNVPTISDSAGTDHAADEPVEEPEDTSSSEPQGTVERLLATMTLEQKVAQLFLVTPEQLTGVSKATVAGSKTERTLQDTATLTVKAATSQVPGTVSEKLIAFADFDLDPEGSGADVMLARGTNASGVTATYSTNSTQSGTAHNGNAFVMTPGKTAPHITLSFDGLELTDGDGLAISFWVQNGTSSGDWSTIAEAANGSGKGGRIQFMNISVDISTANGNRYPGSGGVLTGSATWDDLIDNTEWAYITVVANNVGVYFYENGELLCTYADTDAANVWDAFMYQINNNGTIKFFGNNESSVNFYIDDLLLTTGLDMDGVAALYAAVSGTAEA